MSVGVKGVNVVPDVVLDKLERPVEEECKMKHNLADCGTTEHL